MEQIANLSTCKRRQGSNPCLSAISGCSVARLSRRVWDAEVAGSNPATPTKHLIYLGMWRSLVAHTHGVRGVAGSNPVIPTK